MTDIDAEQLQFVVGGLRHPPSDPSGTRPSGWSDFKKSFEHHRDNGTPMWPGQQFKFLPNPDNWGGGGGQATG
jgi:hypothetical protein